MEHRHMWSQLGCLSGAFKYFKCLIDGCGQVKQEN